MNKKKTFETHLRAVFGLAGFLMVSSAFGAVDESTIGDAMGRIVSFVLKYIAPAIFVLLFVRSGFKLAQGEPDAMKSLINTSVGAAIAFGALGVLNYLLGTTYKL